jgi:hypothetical protein
MPKLAAEIVPALEMPPVKVGPAIMIEVPPEEAILLVVSSDMPPAITPVVLMKPAIVPFWKVMPEGEMVPSLVMLPVKLVFFTHTLATV